MFKASYLIVLLGVLLVLLGVLLVGCCCCGDMPPPSPEMEEWLQEELQEAPKVVEPVAPATPDVTVTAKTLLKAYEENQFAADSAYKDKRLRVSGKLSNVTTGFFSGVDVNINGGGDFEFTSVTCSFDTAPPGVEKLKPGDSVTFDGDCSGGMVIGVSLDNCRLVSP